MGGGPPGRSGDPLGVERVAFFSFGLSFWVIGRFWVGHHLTFQHIKRWDPAMVWINLLLLACIAFLPFPTAVLGNNINLAVAARLYAASVMVTGLAFTLLWWYATGRGRLVDEDLDPRFRRSTLLRTLATPIVFGLSIPLVTVRVAVGVGWLSLAPLLWVLLGAGSSAGDPPRRPGAATLARQASAHEPAALSCLPKVLRVTPGGPGSAVRSPAACARCEH